MKPHSKKVKARTNKINWDGLFKAITALVAVGGFAFGIYQYHLNTKREQAKAAREAQLTLANKQWATYYEASRVAGEFARESKREQAQQRLTELWGLFEQITLLEPPPLQKARKRFLDALKRWEEVNSRPDDDFLPPHDFTFPIDPKDPNSPAMTFAELAADLSAAMSEAMKQMLLKLSDQASAQHIQRRL